MAYRPNVWKDGPDGRTPITAAALTKIEEGIRVASATADTAVGGYTENSKTVQSLSTKAGSLESLIKVIQSQLVPIGTVVAFAGQVVPDGWLFCYGQALKRSEYPELFAALGTTAGSGDGSTTFNIPDWRGKVTYGQGGDGLFLPNVTVGEKEHTLTVNEMPSHGHEIVDSNTTTTGGRPPHRDRTSASTATATRTPHPPEQPLRTGAPTPTTSEETSPSRCAHTASPPT